MDGRWSGADASLAGDWAESLFHRLNIDPKQHKMRRATSLPRDGNYLPRSELGSLNRNNSLLYANIEVFRECTFQRMLTCITENDLPTESGDRYLAKHSPIFFLLYVRIISFAT
ncbi:unnamed protein product [Arabidopsis thaliana]|uniref:Uncharacterized protein n=1 Tax=Arabidopsis thaliana TaxID=3702 RepID=A0A5S9WPW0_ARATH|nr:unnamed protein product [Arabidopsis thaliana]VYS49161.1 unnamed protein product [Arabidopsis thaliana]